VLAEELPPVRVIVTRYLAPSPASTVKVGKRVGEWMYELFITTRDADGFLCEDVVNLYHGRGAFETIFAEEDLEDDPDRWCSYTQCGKAALADRVEVGSAISVSPSDTPCRGRSCARWSGLPCKNALHDCARLSSPQRPTAPGNEPETVVEANCRPVLFLCTMKSHSAVRPGRPSG
jgi:hypothetical protein